MKSVLDILVDNLKIGRGGFSNEKQIYGVLASSIEIEKKITDARIEELKKAKTYWLHDCASWCDGRITELEKERKNNEKT